jgi:GDP/UDP-N,N'-diacetylbacillosamine 2-epimerase (hydrolysing)
MVRIGVLTSSRADFGVYLPLLKALQNDSEIVFELIVFGTHLSNYHGRTIDEIEGRGFVVKYKIPTTLSEDSEEAISTSAALTSLKFSSFWAIHKKDFNIVLCIGDRYEMFSAVISGIPFGIKFAHFYGGDYSQGSIDNVYRDGMTHASVIHFTSIQKCAERVRQMLNKDSIIKNIGILSLDNVEKADLLSIEEFKEKWCIDLREPTILVTFHPETVFPENNRNYANLVTEVLEIIKNDYQIVITMPNADTLGNIYREAFKRQKNKFQSRIHLVENFGSISYFTCMKYCVLMIGNTSSGISEAASFNKYFINVGRRQTGRDFGPNIISVEFSKNDILKEINNSIKKGPYLGENIYLKKGSVELIISTIKAYFK